MVRIYCLQLSYLAPGRADELCFMTDHETDRVLLLHQQLLSSFRCCAIALSPLRGWNADRVLPHPICLPSPFLFTQTCQVLVSVANRIDIYSTESCQWAHPLVILRSSAVWWGFDTNWVLICQARLESPLYIERMGLALCNYAMQTRSLEVSGQRGFGKTIL